MYVLDGGYLLHTLQWPTDAKYQQICQTYVDYVTVNYGENCIFIFDGYDDTMSTKVSEQQRRAAQNTLANIIFEWSMKFAVNWKPFLQNWRNKSRLIINIHNRGLASEWFFSIPAHWRMRINSYM